MKLRTFLLSTFAFALFGAAVASAGTQVIKADTKTGVIDTPSAGLYDFTGITVHGLSGGSWGSIAGTLTNQTDLNTVLDGKAPVRVYDLGTYGAAGDITSDDTAISNALSAITTSGGGVLYFPVSGLNYRTSGGITLPAGTIVMGNGSVTTSLVDPTFTTKPTAFVTNISCASRTATVFTVSNPGCGFQDLAIVNTASLAPTAGAGILISNHGSFMSLRGLVVSGFYDCIDFAEGYSWTLKDSFIYAPVRYGLRIRNTSHSDAGDQTVTNVTFVSDKYVSSAAIRYESGGGLKLSNIKVNGAPGTNLFQHGIDCNFGTGVGTGDLFVTNSSFENYTGNGINIVSSGGTFGKILISNSEFLNYPTNTTGHGIAADGTTNIISNVQIANCNFQAAGADSAVIFTNVVSPSIMGGQTEGYSRLVQTVNCALDTQIPQPTFNGLSIPDGSIAYNARVRDDTAFAAGVGGGIEFQGKYDSAGDVAGFGGIRSYKANGTDGDYGTRTGLWSRTNGGGVALGLMVDEAQNVNIQGKIIAQVNASAPAPAIGQAGDIIAARSATTGVYYFGTTGAKYVYYDGTNYQFANGSIVPSSDAGYALGSSGERWSDIYAASYHSSDGTAGASATTGGATFKNGLYVSGSVSAGGTIASTSSVLKGDGSGNAVAATAGTDFLAANPTAITGGAGNMTITSGTGNSRTMIFKTTTSGGTATTALTLNADQSATFPGAVTITGKVTPAGADCGDASNRFSSAYIDSTRTLGVILYPGSFSGPSMFIQSFANGQARVYDTNTSGGGVFYFPPNTATTLSASVNNYTPSNNSKFQRWSSNASWNVTGLTFTSAQAGGEEHIITNVGSQNIVLVNESASSTAANRFHNTTAADITLSADQEALIWYDDTTARWRVSKMN